MTIRVVLGSAAGCIFIGVIPPLLIPIVAAPNKASVPEPAVIASPPCTLSVALLVICVGVKDVGLHAVPFQVSTWLLVGASLATSRPWILTTVVAPKVPVTSPNRFNAAASSPASKRFQ